MTMKRILSISLAGFLGLSTLTACGLTNDTVASKVGEIELTDNEEVVRPSEDAEETLVETDGLTENNEESAQTEFYVGDTYADSNVEITFLASGDYVTDNEFMFPEDGKKYIFLKFFVKNVSENMDMGITPYEFSCYADGYDANAFYGINEELSATLSPGRTTTGNIAFEVPVDASDIDVEYEVNIFTEKKIHFIFEGDKDSGIVPEVETTASEEVYKVGDILETSAVRISYLAAGEYESGNEFIVPEDGNRFIFIELEFENISETDQFISDFGFNCYADGASCNQRYLMDEESLSAELSSGRKKKGKVVFEVPVDASIIEVEYDVSVWTSKHVVFAVE